MMLVARELRKSFGGKPALCDVSFAVAKGSIHGLLGHNGAGKSTSLGIILGMVEPDRGEVFIGGISVQRARAQALRKVGAIFEAPAFYDYLSGWKNLELFMNYSGGFDAKAAAAVVAEVGLSERIHSRVRTYSHGMRQRLALAQALLPEPEILLLDEPTDGLDPEGIKWFRDFILSLRNHRGMTVLFNSHLLSEVEQMCDEVTILRQGRIVHRGSLEALQDGEPVFEVEMEPWSRATEVVAANGARVLGPARIEIPHGLDPAHIVRACVAEDVAVRRFNRVKRSLEDVYLSLAEQ